MGALRLMAMLQAKLAPTVVNGFCRQCQSPVPPHLRRCGVVSRGRGVEMVTGEAALLIQWCRKKLFSLRYKWTSWSPIR